MNGDGILRLVLVLVGAVCCVSVAGMVALGVAGKDDGTAFAAVAAIATTTSGPLVAYAVRLLQRAGEERRARDTADSERRREELKRIHKMPS